MKLSVGAVRLSRWRPGRHGLAAARSVEVRRIAAHLRGTVPDRAGGPAALAVVPVDDPQVAALAVVSMALSRARDGLQRRAGGPGQRHARCLARGQRRPRSQAGDRARYAADPRGARP